MGKVNLKPIVIGLAMHVGEVLHSWRECNGLSVYALSKASGLRAETINNIERGDGSLLSFLTYLECCRLLDNNRDYSTLIKALFWANTANQG